MNKITDPFPTFHPVILWFYIVYNAILKLSLLSTSVPTKVLLLNFISVIIVNCS